MEREFKTTKNKYDTVLTCAEDAVEAANVASWTVANRMFVFTDVPMEPAFGLYPKSPRINPITLREMVGAYMMERPGYEVVAIAGPSVILGGDPSIAYHTANENRFERTWAAFAKMTPDAVPSLFIMATTFVPHLLRECPADLSMYGAWRHWLHQWISGIVSRDRYLDLSNRGLLVQPNVAESLPPQIVAEIKEEAASVAKVKRKYKKRA